MNYLAHYYLARSQKGLIVGNFLTDYARGNSFQELPAEIQKGVLLHRKIDDYTDHHEVVAKTKERLRPKYRKFAPVIADVFYDHVLARNWETYSEVDLKTFSTSIYDTLHEFKKIYPVKAVATLYFMSNKDWLYHYRSSFGIGKALQGLSRRASFANKMNEAIEDLETDYPLIEEEFNLFFGDLIQYCEQEIKSLNQQYNSK